MMPGDDAAQIDAVITWVDGGDPVHRRNLEALLASQGGVRPKTALPTRFNDAGELEYCLASILRYAPWFRTIHIVTGGQRPALLAQLEGTQWAGRVRLVDHREVFSGYSQYLPTFNSRAIITALWRIPGLAERFVYFNDDFMLLQPVVPEDFFRGDAPVLRGKWMTQAGHRWGRRLIQALRSLRRGHGGVDRAASHDAQERAARLAGFERRYYRMYHNPYPMRRSTLAAFFRQHPELLDSNLRERLRSSTQFKTECLAAHLEIAQGRMVQDNRRYVIQLKPSSQSAVRVAAKLARADRDPDAAFVCVQSMELAPGPIQARIVQWLRRRIGHLEQALEASRP